MPIIADIYRNQNGENKDEDSRRFFDGHSQLLIVNIEPEVEVHHGGLFKMAMVVDGYLADGPQRIVPAVKPKAWLGGSPPEYVPLYTLIEQESREMSKAVFGDGFVWSNDLRWKFDQPLPLHDRYVSICGCDG